MKQGKINIEIGKPITIIDWKNDETKSPNERKEKRESTILKAIGTTLKEYQKNIKNLVSGKYINQRDLMPPHLQKPCNIYVLLCTDGILVRYDDVTDGEGKVRTGIMGKELCDIAPKVSDYAIHFPKDFSNYTSQIRGPQLSMAIGKIDTPQTDLKEVGSLHYELFSKTVMPEGYTILPPPSRPVPLVSLGNEVIINMQGKLVPDEVTPKEVYREEQLITYSKIKLPVGWLAIEVYPLLDQEYWKPEYTTVWAELDILSILAQKNAIRSELFQFDSRSETRKKYSQLLHEFEGLLVGLEEPMHQFLKANPELLCPTHDKCWSKVHFGSTISDFVFREAYNDYLLVEIEAPIRELFRKDGQQRQEVTHAINQITDWVQYIQNNRQKVEKELGLIGISTNPRTLIVIGRSQSLTLENRKKIETLQSQQNKLRIMTYDDVLLNAKESLSRLFGNLDIKGNNTEIYYSGKCKGNDLDPIYRNA